MSKLAGWKGVSVQLTTETRFGKLVNAGNVVPVATHAISPLKSGTVFSITAFNVSKTFPVGSKKKDLVVVGAGRFIGIDTVSDPFSSGAGHTMFMNPTFNALIATGRIVPTITNGATFAWVRNGSPFVTAAVFDSTGSFTKPGLKNLFSKGVSFVSGINFPTKVSGKSGKHSFSGAVTTKAYTPFDQYSEVVIPGTPARPITPKKGSWNVSYNFHQYLRENVQAGRPSTGWGVFGNLQLADESTNPLRGIAVIGLGGNGLFKQRRSDRFGIAYAFVGISDTLKREIEPLIRLGDEQVFESFYSLSITPFITLTGNLQIVRPSLKAADTAVIPGARLVVNF